MDEGMEMGEDELTGEQNLAEVIGQYLENDKTKSAEHKEGLDLVRAATALPCCCCYKQVITVDHHHHHHHRCLHHRCRLLRFHFLPRPDILQAKLSKRPEMISRTNFFYFVSEWSMEEGQQLSLFGEWVRLMRDITFIGKPSTLANVG